MLVFLLTYLSIFLCIWLNLFQKKRNLRIVCANLPTQGNYLVWSAKADPKSYVFACGIGTFFIVFSEHEMILPAFICFLTVATSSAMFAPKEQVETKSNAIGTGNARSSVLAKEWISLFGDFIDYTSIKSQKGKTFLIIPI